MNESILPQTRPIRLVKAKGLVARVYPGGDFVVFRANAYDKSDDDECDRTSAQSAEGAGEALGLSSLNNFDKSETGMSRYGLKGISVKGRRTIRACVWMLERQCGASRLSLATLTLPSLPFYELKILHQHWHKLVELYRLYVGRWLVDRGLPGQIVGCTEVQEKRQERDDIPALHLHCVFVGRKAGRSWALGTLVHDSIWRRVISVVLGRQIGEIPAACKLERTRSGAHIYLSKYLSKGAQTIEKIAEDDKADWLPKQWWNCSRSLTKRMKAATLEFSKGARELLYIVSQDEKQQFCIWQRTAVEDIAMGKQCEMATYGRLSRVGFELSLSSWASPENLAEYATLMN